MSALHVHAGVDIIGKGISPDGDVVGVNDRKTTNFIPACVIAFDRSSITENDVNADNAVVMGRVPKHGIVETYKYQYAEKVTVAGVVPNQIAVAELNVNPATLIVVKSIVVDAVAVARHSRNADDEICHVAVPNRCAVAAGTEQDARTIEHVSRRRPGQCMPIAIQRGVG